MAEEAKKSNPFLSMFVPGLILGLLVGGMAGAYLTPQLESLTNRSARSGPPALKPVAPLNERDARPAAPAGGDAKLPDTKPPEPKPVTPPDTTPGDKPQTPATPPATAPK